MPCIPVLSPSYCSWQKLVVVPQATDLGLEKFVCTLCQYRNEKPAIHANASWRLCWGNYLPTTTLKVYMHKNVIYFEKTWFTPTVSAPVINIYIGYHKNIFCKKQAF